MPCSSPSRVNTRRGGRGRGPGPDRCAAPRSSAGRTVVVDEDLPAPRAQVGLLVELAGRAEPGRLAATSSRPAGSSHSKAPTGWRYCWMSNTWSRPATSRSAMTHRTRVVDILAADVAGFTELCRGSGRDLRPYRCPDTSRWAWSPLAERGQQACA